MQQLIYLSAFYRKTDLRHVHFRQLESPWPKKPSNSRSQSLTLHTAQQGRRAERAKNCHQNRLWSHIFLPLPNSKSTWQFQICLYFILDLEIELLIQFFEKHPLDFVMILLFSGPNWMGQNRICLFLLVWGKSWIRVLKRWGMTF